MITQHMPAQHIPKYAVVHHVTSLEAAFSILKSNSIYGRDKGKHANFGAITPRAKLAKSCEVSLEFHWEGEQKLYFGDPFLLAPDHEVGGPQPNILYHVFQDTALEDGQNDLAGKNYWQSVLYPGSSGLVLKNVRNLLYTQSKSKPLLKRLLSSKARTEHDDYSWAENVTKELSLYIGELFDVPILAGNKWTRL